MAAASNWVDSAKISLTLELITDSSVHFLILTLIYLQSQGLSQLMTKLFVSSSFKDAASSGEKGWKWSRSSLAALILVVLEQRREQGGQSSCSFGAVQVG